jgi:hypothetical protein
MRRLGLGGGGRQCPRPNAARRRKNKLRLSFCIGLSALCLHLAVAAPTRAEDYYPDRTPEAQGLLSGMFGEKSKAPAKRQSKGPSKGQTKNDPRGVEVKPQPIPTVAATAAEQQRHMNAWFRRMEVCDRLRTIANQTGDEALMNQANELEERANLIYRQQTSVLPMPVQTPLSVLADDRQSPSRVSIGPAASAQLPNPKGRRPGGLWSSSSSSAPRLEGSMDQREQAILNGTNMGGNGP